MKSAFSTYHPVVSLAYFTAVLAFSMILMHPAALCISLLGALLWSAQLGGKKALGRNLLFMVPILLFTALLNPAFNHEGITILLYLPTGNPLTLESILYGAAAGAMLAAVICWFSCFNRVMTSDKLTYLFGRIIPALSLLLSMALRFVPRFRQQMKVVSNAQRCIGRDTSNGNLIYRVRHGVRILSIMITWSLENAIETADSMKSRGYGLKGRTAFSIYRFQGRDRTALAAILSLAAFILVMWAAGGLYYRYFPSFRIAPWDAWSLCGHISYGMLCLMPTAIDVFESRRWRKHYG